MKTFGEMRQEAWDAATSRWWFRYVCVVLCLGVPLMLLLMMQAVFYNECGIKTLQMFLQEQMKSDTGGFDLALLETDFWKMAWASAFQYFVKCLVQGLCFFGFMTLALRAVDDREEGWFASCFAGLRIPVGVLWLTVLRNVCIFLWTLLLIVPGINACFRYQMAWFVKVEHPDYSASRCLDESSALMDGHKWRYFFYTLSYFGWALLILLTIGLAIAVSEAMPLVTAVLFALAMGMVLFLVVYMTFGQAAFYRELVRISKSKTVNHATVVES